MAFQALNRLKWNGGIEGCSITITHRGAPGNVRIIGGADVREVKKSYFIYVSEGRETFIPLHRIRKMECAGEVVWKRPARKG